MTNCHHHVATFFFFFWLYKFLTNKHNCLQMPLMLLQQQTTQLRGGATQMQATHRQ